MNDRVSASLVSGGRLLVLRGVQYVLIFVGGLVVARALGPAGRGEYMLPLNLAMTVWVVSHLSIEAAAARLLGQQQTSWRDVTRVCSAATLLLGSIGFVVAFEIGLAVRKDALGGATATSIALAAATIPPTIAGQLAAALLFRRGHLRAYGFVLAIVAAAQLSVLLAVELGSGLTPESTLAVNLGTVAAGSAALVVLVARDLGLTALVPRPPRGLLLRALGLGAVLHASSVMLYLNLRIDLLLVGVLLSVREAGLYSLAATLAELVLVAASTVGLAALRSQTELDDEDAVAYTLDFTRQSLALTTVFTLAVAACAYPLVVLGYGSEWEGAVAPLAILTVGAIGLAVETPIRGLLLRLAEPWRISLAATLAATVNVALNLALLPAIGIIGAAIASACSYWIAAGLMLALFKRTTGASIGRALALPKNTDLLSIWVRRVVSRP